MKIISLLVFTLLSFIKGFSQDASLSTFKNNKFELQYPKKFKIDSTGKQYSFFLSKNLGDITVSTYENNSMTDKELEKAVLDLNGRKDPKPTIKTATLNGLTQCTYNYTADNVRWFIKAIKKKNSLYVISLNWNDNSWPEFQEILLKSFNSFRPI